MGRRKKQRDWEDWDDEPDESDITPDAPEVAKISLKDFVIQEKVQAFVNAYEPCQEGDMGCEVFNDARLREFFKGYVLGLGDPMKLYIEDLKLAGFHMTVSAVSEEPCIFARRKTKQQ